jgi:hypothetical protein
MRLQQQAQSREFSVGSVLCTLRGGKRQPDGEQQQRDRTTEAHASHR